MATNGDSREGNGGLREARQVAGWIAIGLALVAATYVAASTWERVKTRPPDRTIQVTGSAKKRIVSDLIEWTGHVEVQHPSDRVLAYRTLHEHTEKVVAYLRAQGIKDAELQPSSASVERIIETEQIGRGENMIARQIQKGWRATQSVVVRSTNVALVERISREVTRLLEEGISLTSAAPAYYYTKLGGLKIEMLAEAAKDARTRAENMVRSAGGAAIYNLRSADMGIINVNPANSTETSAQGNNDATSLEKDIITIVHVVYELR
jgi:hypothetical protein